jgi:predicted  nucleic acid-binding Zn-ribbon protein
LENQEDNVELTLSIPIIPEEDNTSKDLGNEQKQNEVLRSIVGEAVDTAVKVILKEVNKLHQALTIQIVKAVKELSMQTSRISREIAKLSSMVADISEKINETSAARGDSSKQLETIKVMETLKDLSSEVKLVAEENVKISKAINELRESLNTSNTLANFKHIDEAYSRVQTLLKTSMEQLNELEKHIGEAYIAVKELLKTLKSENILKDIRSINIALRELTWHIEEMKLGMKQY